MREFGEVMGSAAVPDPGEGYWESFSRRVDSMLPEQGTTFWTVFRRRAVLFASSAAAGLLVAFIAASMTNEGVPVGSPAVKPVVAESRVTVTLASNAEGFHSLLVLSNSAMDKANLAQVACSEGNWDSIAPLARSYEKILSVGLAASLQKAVDEDVDVEPFLDDVLAAASEGAAFWKTLSASADPRFAAEVEAAIKASQRLEQTLDESFGKSRG